MADEEARTSGPLILITKGAKPSLGYGTFLLILAVFLLIAGFNGRFQAFFLAILLLAGAVMFYRGRRLSIRGISKKHPDKS